jgi:hypothetical protein
MHTKTHTITNTTTTQAVDTPPYPVCPRCGGPIPSAEYPGQYPGAISRTDNETEVCSRCGTAEAFEQAVSSLLPQVAWPVSSPLARRFYRVTNELWRLRKATAVVARTQRPAVTGLSGYMEF